MSAALQVCNKYLEEGFDFLLNAFNSPSYLEDLTGLSQLHAETHDYEVSDGAVWEITRASWWIWLNDLVQDYCNSIADALELQ